MSDRARPDLALKELELLVRSLGEELAGFRRRALDAERRLRDAAAQPAGAEQSAAPAAADGDGASAERVRELEQENERLRTRLAEASARTRQMVERVRFLRQQQEQDGDK